MLPTPFAIFVAIAAWRVNGDTILRTFMLSCLFGATAAFTLPALGNAPVTPAVAMVPVLVWRALAGRDINDVLAHIAPGKAGFWLLLLLVWGIAGAVLLPRLFAGQTYVFSTSRNSDALGFSRSLLGPNSTNITQTAYLALGVVVYLAVSLLMEARQRAIQFAMAVVALGIANSTAAIIGLLEYCLGIDGPVSLVKNAAYANFNTYEVMGLARVTGTFPEASGFASFSMPLLAFVASLWRSGFRPQLTGPLALVLLALLVFSTSTTAYVALAVYAVFLALSGLWKLTFYERHATLGWGTAVVSAVVATACLTILILPHLLEVVWRFLETMVVNKLDSSSGVERSSWNVQAWVNTKETYGMGAGLGSVRASSYPFVLLSNVGFLGAFLFMSFIVRAAVPRTSSLDDSTAIPQLAARHAIVAALIAASLSAGVFDLGVAFYAFAAVAVASPNWAEAASVAEHVDS